MPSERRRGVVMKVIIELEHDDLIDILDIPDVREAIKHIREIRCGNDTRSEGEESSSETS